MRLSRRQERMSRSGAIIVAATLMLVPARAGADVSAQAVGDATQAVDGATQAVGDAVGDATQAVDDATQAVGGAVDDATQAVGGAVDDATQAVGGAVDDATQAVGGAVGECDPGGERCDPGGWGTWSTVRPRGQAVPSGTAGRPVDAWTGHRAGRNRARRPTVGTTQRRCQGIRPLHGRRGRRRMQTSTGSSRLLKERAWKSKATRALGKRDRYASGCCTGSGASRTGERRSSASSSRPERPSSS